MMSLIIRKGESGSGTALTETRLKTRLTSFFAKGDRLPIPLAPTSLLVILFLILCSLPLHSLPSKKVLQELKVLPRSEIFFTQMENCYSLEIPDVEPGKVQLDLPELPLGTKFISSKKEEYASEDGARGTQISLWFTFTDSGNTRIPPLFTRINGRIYYFEFEPTYVYENPALISPLAEVLFDRPELLKTDKKTGQKTLRVACGEKISFTVALRYGMQVIDFRWKLPKDSIFNETERFDFANGEEKITEFTTESKKLASFDWQILKEGIYPLPEIAIGTISYSGAKKQVYLPQNIFISVSETKNRKTGAEAGGENSGIFESAFEKPEDDEINSRNAGPDRQECEKIAMSTKRTFFDKLFARRYGIFAGGEIISVPEEKISGRAFTGGQKVRISERAGKWSFIECKEFSGWTKNDNIIEVK
ncbi:MAG: hypothetical protein IKO39_05235 [Treponema sp.]|nr:hypothetical protein [Treponema sp.]